MEYGVIMAGGAGTRLWPLSRGNKPKQLLSVIGPKSLIQLSYQRLRGILPPERIYVCTGAAHTQAVMEHLPELPAENLLGEPVGRDTANAVGFSCAVLLKKDPDAVAAFVTADHIIEPIDQFQTSLQSAFAVAKQNPQSLVTFGIVPTHGHTGLGYIHRGEALPGVNGAFRVQAFKEKPDKPTADRYVESGRYYWNSGMFVWRADTLLQALQLNLPESYASLIQVAEAWQTPRRTEVLEQIYPQLKKISIDYAVLEPASQGKGDARVITVEMPVQWLDVGSWPALAEILQLDDHDNATRCQTSIIVDSDNNIIVSENPRHLVAVLGVSDMIIVQTPDVTMICPKSEAQRVKDLSLRAKDKFGDQFQ